MVSAVNVAEVSFSKPQHRDVSFALVEGFGLAAMVDGLAFTWKRVTVMPVAAPGSGTAMVGLAGRF